MSGSHTKAMLRARALERRNALAGPDRERAAAIVAERVAALISVGGDEMVSGYWPIRSELDPGPLLRAFGARICLPAIRGEELEFREHRAGAPLEPQGFGTFAPGVGTAVVLPDILLVPLAAFDRRRQRIGYGRGFYDRAIAALRAEGRGRLAIGLAFSAQEVDAVPAEPHDVALDLIATEREVLRG